MSLNILTAAHYLCDKSGWTLSNLKLQKLFYFAQMVALGEFNEKIVRDDFQAWVLGPVNADLYHEVKIYGSAPVGSLHTGNDAPSGVRRHLLDQTPRSMDAMSVGELILISHWTKGAWAKHYVSGKKQSNSQIGYGRGVSDAQRTPKRARKCLRISVTRPSFLMRFGQKKISPTLWMEKIR